LPRKAGRSPSRSGRTSSIHNAPRLRAVRATCSMRAAPTSPFCRLRCRCHRSLHALLPRCFRGPGRQGRRPRGVSARASSDKGKALSIKLVHILQFDDAQRLDKLNTFIAANADFAPAYFPFGTGVFRGSPRAPRRWADKRNEAKALTKFVSYEKDGRTAQNISSTRPQLADWLDRSRGRLAALWRRARSLSLRADADADALQPGLVDDHLAAGSRRPAISWRMGDSGPFHRYTGFPGAQRPDHRQRPMPNPSFELPDSTLGRHHLRSNISISGAARQGPVRHPLRPQIRRSSKATSRSSTSFWTSWIAFDSGGKFMGWSIFTQMLSYPLRHQGGALQA